MAAPTIGYEVRYRPAGTAQAWKVESFGPDSTTLSLSGLARGTNYEGEARSIGPNGLSSAWVPVTFTVAGASLVPLAPTGLAATTVADGVALKWNVADQQRTDVEYRIDRAPDAGGVPGVWAELTRVRALQYTDPVTDQARRWYRVRAVSFAGIESTVSSAVDRFGKAANVISSESAPANPSIGTQWYQPSSKLTRYWNGAGWSLMADLALTQSSGRELLRNATFTSRQQGVTYTPGSTGVYVDSWNITDDGGSAGAARWWQFPLEPTGIMFRLASNATMPHNTQATGIIRAERVAVAPGVRLRAITSIDSAWMWNSFPAGCTLLIRTYVDCYAGDGSPLSSTTYDIVRTGGTVVSGAQVTTPPNTAMVEFALVAYFVNLSGAPVVTGTLPWDARVKVASLVVMNELEVAGSGARIGDQRNLPQSITTAYGSVRNATALSASSTGAVSVNAHIVRYGGASVAYNAVANAVTGLAQNTRYVIYCIDPTYAGGTQTWLAGTNPDAVMQLGDGVVIAGEITIPTSGTGSGGGGSGGSGGDWCVDADMVLPDGRRAGDIKAGEAIACWNDDVECPGVVHLLVEGNELVPLQPSLQLVTESGATVVASESTPMTLRDGRVVRMPDMLGEDALVRHADGLIRWERVAELSAIGPRTVAKIRVHQRCYFAGRASTATVATHNPIQKP